MAKPITATLCCWWMLFASAPPHTVAASRPNFVVIMADDMGYSDAGCYGGEIKTPHLDALAHRGLRFTQYYSTGRCWPSRATLLTGYYAQQVGMDPRKGYRWPRWTRLLPQYLNTAGYRCYHSGKWHVRHTPVDKEHSGFARSYWMRDHDRFFSPQRHTLDDRPLPEVQRGSGYYVTSAITEYALTFLREHHRESPTQPFFLYLAFTSPHFPLHALEEDIARYRKIYLEGWDAIRQQRWERMREAGIISCDLSRLRPDVIAPWSLPEKKLQEHIGAGESGKAVAWKQLTPDQKEFQAHKMAIHAAMVDRIDQEVGRVVEQVKSMNAFDNTVFFFVSDNGASAEQIIRGDLHNPSAPLGSAGSYLCLGPGWSSAANTPLALHKHWNHEGGISSPLIIHWPAGITAAGELRHSPGHFIDLVPTILDIAGIDHRSLTSDATPPPFPGRSLRPAFAADRGDWGPRTLFFAHAGNRAIRSGDWKAVLRVNNAERWELYNLARDRCENVNLARDQPERLEELRRLWIERTEQFEKDRVHGQ